MGLIAGAAANVALLLPGAAGAALLGGAAGCGIGRCHRPRFEGRPLRRLKFAAKTCHDLIAANDTQPLEWKQQVLDDAVRAFYPWAQKARDGGATGEIRLHLAPLYLLMQRHAIVAAVEASAASMSAAFERGSADASTVDRCFYTFSTIGMAITEIGRLSEVERAELLATLSRRRCCGCGDRPIHKNRLGHASKVVETLLWHPDVALVVRRRRQQEKVTEGEYFSCSDTEAEASIDFKRCKRIKRRCSNMPEVSATAGEETYAERDRSLPRGDTPGTWDRFPAINFPVRSATYLTNRKKLPSGPMLFEPFDVDWHALSSAGPVWRVNGHPAFGPENFRQRGDTRFFLIFNMIIPPYQCIISTALDPAAPWLGDTPQGRLWNRFLAMTPDERRQKLKIICSVEAGSYVASKAAPKKPVIIGRRVKMDSYLEPGDSLEIVIQPTSSKSEEVATGIVLRAIKSLHFALCFVLEATNQDELPEQALTCLWCKNVDAPNLPKPAGVART